MGELTSPIVSDKRTLDREARLQIHLFGTFQVTSIWITPTPR